MEQEYLILQCPACERSVKIKSDTTATRMGCPYCKEPIELSSGEAEAEAPRPSDEDLPEAPPLEFRRIEGVEPVSAHSGAGPDPSSKPQGERRRHRKRHADTLGWDEEQPRGGSGRSDKAGVDDDSSEFLEMDPDSPGGVRLKRVRRKKILTGRDKFFRVLTAAVVLAAVVIAGFIIYSFVMQTTSVIGTEAETLQKLPEEIRVLIEEARVNPITEYLTNAEEEIAASVLDGFFKAKTIDERLQFVRDQERIRPLMEKWYADNPQEATREWPDGTILLRNKVIDQDRYFIILAVEFAGEGKRVVAIEQKPDGEMRLDWETAVGYQPMPLEEFKAARPTQPVKFWVKIKPSDFYNFQFSDSGKYQAVELSYPGKDFQLIGYIDRDKEWAPALIEEIESGAAPSMIVELAYPDKDVTDDSLVEIHSIVSESWWQ